MRASAWMLLIIACMASGQMNNHHSMHHSIDNREGSLALAQDRAPEALEKARGESDRSIVFSSSLFEISRWREECRQVCLSLSAVSSISGIVAPWGRRHASRRGLGSGMCCQSACLAPHVVTTSVPQQTFTIMTASTSDIFVVDLQFECCGRPQVC